MERLKQLVEWFDNAPFEDMPKKAQKEISDGIVELIKYKALGTLDDLAALVQAESKGRLYDIGDTVYCTTPLHTGIAEGKVQRIIISKWGADLEIDTAAGMARRKSEDAYTTREAAEAALSEMEEQE